MKKMMNEAHSVSIPSSPRGTRSKYPPGRWLLAVPMLLGLLILGGARSTILAAPSRPAVQVAQGRTVITNMSNEELEALLREMGFEPQKVRDNVFRFRVEGFTTLLFNQKGDMQLYAGFSEKKATAQMMNDWNKNQRYTRAYLDKDGDPVIESDLDLEGGVTPENVRVFIVTFRTLLPSFAKLVGQ